MTAPVVPTFSGPLPLKTDLVNYETNSQRLMNELPGVISGMNDVAAYMNANMPTVADFEEFALAVDAIVANEENINAVAAALPELAEFDLATVVRTVGAQEIGGPKTFTDFAEGPAGASGNQFPRANETVLKAGDPQVMSVDLTVPSINGGQLAGQRRKNVNGACAIAQAGTSFACPANTWTRTIDGFEVGLFCAAVATATQSTDVPAGSGFQFSHHVTINTADASIAAGDFAVMLTYVEGYDAYDLIGKPTAASFWMRSPKTGTHGVAFQNAAGDRSYITTVVVNAANTWEKKTVQLPNGLITAGSWDWGAGCGLYAYFTLAAGTTYRNTAGSWLTGSYFTTSAQVNVCDTVGNIFAVTGVQIGLGAVDTPYEHMRHANELAWAQRYLRPNGCLTGVSTSTTNITGAAVDFTGAPMRAAPTVVLKNGTNGAHDAGVTFRNISSPVYSGNGLGGYVQVTCTTTTNNKLHNIIQGALLFDSRL